MFFNISNDNKKLNMYSFLQLKLTNFAIMNIQSPQFSSSSKIDITSKLSPSLRNKRIPSLQQGYLCHWNRVNSCRKLDSPSKISQKNRKRSHNSQQRVKTKINVSHNIVQQLCSLKNQYTSLKIAYQEMIQNKVRNDEQVSRIKLQSKTLKDQNEKIIKENEKLRNKLKFLEMEIQRIKKQCLKLIQIQQFRSHKLEQNLIQKQKAIASLMESFKIENHVEIPLLTTNESEQQRCNRIIQISENTNYFPCFESLTFSHDKTLSNSQFISISLTSMMESQSQVRQELSTRRHNIIAACPQKTLTDKQNKDNEQKGIDSFKKLRKEITKKIEVNVDERTKQSVPQIGSIKTPMDRKNSKSNRGSKTKLKRDEDSLDNRSSKKKIVNK